MLDINEIYNRLQCCYSCLIGEQINNISKLIIDDTLNYRITRAYSLIQLKISNYLKPEDYEKYNKSVNEICGGCDCGTGYSWIGIDPICEDDGIQTTSTTSTSSSTSTTTASITTSSTSTTTKVLPPPTTTSTTSTTNTSTTSTTTNTSTTSTTTSTSSSTSTTTVQGTETTIVPAWISSAAFSYDANTHEGSLYNNTTQSTELRIESTDGSNPSGISSDGIVWGNGIWIPGTTQFAAPYSRVFRLNPTVNGTGGLIPGSTYKLSFRRTGDNSVIFVKNYTIPLVSQGITDIPLGGVATTSTSSSTTSTTGIGQTTSTSTSSSTSTTTSPVGNTSYILDGKRVTVQNGIRYAFINSQYTILSVLPSGNIKLTYTQSTRPSDNGTGCVPVTMGSYMTDEFNGELTALKSGSGLAVSVGKKGTWYTYWTDPALFTKLSEVTGNELYQAWGQPPVDYLPDSARNHSGGADWCSFEIY